MKLNSTDLGAKLLATENITVIRARTRTASFDVKSRVLTIPQWKDMTPEVEEMLVGHEVGHALYTDQEMLTLEAEERKIFPYINVVEDVRIEKLIKRKYPGIRKTMNEGYRQLNERDFFGIKKIPNLNSLILIDRINLYFKAGYSCGVTFSSEEKQFVVRAEKTETPEDVLSLAHEIYAFSKEQAQKRREQEKQIEPFEESDQEDDDVMYLEGDDPEDTDDDYLDTSEAEDGEDYDPDNTDGGFRDEVDIPKSSLGRTEEDRKEEQKQLEEEAVEEDIKSVTEEIFSEKLAELADESTQHNYYTLDDKFLWDPIVGFKQIISETFEIEERLSESDLKRVVEFKQESSRVVNYLVKEFEMRKSATLYKRAQTSKIGSLDMKKIWSYKLSDDLFKRVMTLPEGKNHGMIFLLDWSGSMDHVLEDTIKQVISLVMFCNRAQIPYQVFAFTTQYDGFENIVGEARRQYYSEENQTKLSNAINSFALLELFSSKMSNTEFNTMVRRILRPSNFTRCKNSSYSTGGTPLNEALSYMVKHIPEFTKTYNIEKLSFITLTDGEGHGLSCGYQSLDDIRYTREDNKRTNQKHFLQDPVTKKNYEMQRHGSTHTEAILQLIKDRYSVNIVGFYICANSRRYIESAIMNNIPGIPRSSAYHMVDTVRKSFKDDGFASLKTLGRNDLFIIPQNKLAVEEGTLKVDENHSAKQIAKNFGKLLSGRTTSRVLLNKFIGYVA
jgi:hypothetical protein